VVLESLVLESVPESVVGAMVAVEFAHATTIPDAAVRTLAAASVERIHSFFCEIAFVIVSGPFEEVFADGGRMKRLVVRCASS
jgi:hypothetical protein